MKAQGGAILVTGNTSSERGRARFAGFAPTKAAQRILTESIARELWPLGIHVAYFVIDAVIDVPWTRERFAGKPNDFFIQPADIADEAFHVAHQPKSAWSRSEEHTSELQSLMRISYAVFCLKKKTQDNKKHPQNT